MQTNKSEYSIDFINRDVKDFPATETRETFHHVQFEDIAMIIVFALIILVFLSQFFQAILKPMGLNNGTTTVKDNRHTSLS